MSQNDFTIANQTFPNTRADINSALQALASTSSGSSAPSTTFANQFFYNTSSNLLQIRNEGNDAYITIAELDQTNDTVEYFKSDSVRTALIEFTDGDDALAIADGGALTTAGNLSIGGSNNELRFYEGANYVGFEAPALSADKIWVLPSADGTSGQALTTNGGGGLSFTTVGGIPARPNVRPLVINGDMNISQRGATITSITSSGYRAVDRFRVGLISSGTWTMSKSTTVPTGQGFATSHKLDCTSANGSLGASAILTQQYKIEGQDLQLFKKGSSNSEYMTIAFWVRSNKTGTYVCELFDNDNNRHIAKTYTIDSANTWEKKVLAFAGDTSGVFGNDNGDSFHIRLHLAGGSNHTSGTLATSWASFTAANAMVGQTVNLADSTSNEWYCTGFQLEVGEYTASTLPPFQHETYTESILRCHRYYIHGVGDTSLNPTAEAASTTTLQPTPQMRCAFRVSPTLTANPVGFIALIGGSGTTTTLIFSNMGINGFRYGLNHNSSVTNKQNIAMGGLGANMDAEI
tara:strand:- start:2128 stop:3687 length:1560 start_codon:yes stop_codon:yes gene_type:complete